MIDICVLYSSRRVSTIPSYFQVHLIVIVIIMSINLLVEYKKSKTMHDQMDGLVFRDSFTITITIKCT